MDQLGHVAQEAKEQAKEIWKLLDYVRGASSISVYRSLAYSLLFIRYMQDNSGLHFDSPKFRSFGLIGNYIDQLAKNCSELGFLTKNIASYISHFIQDILHNHNYIDEEFVRLAIRSNFDNRNKSIALSTLYELNRLFAENESKSGNEFYTPSDVNGLVTELAKSYSPKSICDPFAGGGDTAFAFHEALDGNVDIYTQEINPEVHFQIIVSRIIRGVRGYDYLGDSFRRPAFTEKKYDLIVSFPPFGLKIPSSTREYLLTSQNSPWLELAFNLPDSRCDWLIPLSLISSLTKNGKLIIGMSLSSMTRSGHESAVRQLVVESGVIESIILLPKSIHYSTSISTVLLTINPNRENLNKGIRFVDGSQFYEPHRGRNALSQENIKGLVNSSFSDGRFSTTASYNEIKNKNFNLDPSLYVEKTIKISQVQLNNFRGYKNFTIPLHESLTILVGENGAGKTSILEAIACGLGPFLTAMPDAKGKLIRKSDIYVGPNGIAESARISVETASSLSWDLVTKGSDRNTLAKIGTQALSDFANQIVNNNMEYPLIAYYGTNRALSTSSGKVSISPFEKVQRGEGYDSALDAKINYGVLKNWFSKIEVDELKIRDEKKKHTFTHPAKKLITRAVKQIVERVKDVTFDKDSNDVVVSWRNENDEFVSLSLEQLSEGYRNMVALTIDLVRRAYLLNPGTDYPLDVSGIVLIDEIELHLHPRWQQRIIGDITTLFPNLQIVVTTHSPQVLSTITEQSIRVVNSNTNKAEYITYSTYGAESKRMLEDVLGGDSRPQHIDVVIKLNKYKQLVENGSWDTPEALELKKVLMEWGGGAEVELQRIATDIKIREFDRANEKN
jgi:predicted ATP-binding protein involved in virulence/type I restriction-modification system DNA methylase subunit